MAATISLGVTPIPQGPRQFLIDTLPANSAGVRLAIGLDASWTGASGRLFDTIVDIALDGATFQRWITFGVDGGPVKDRAGNNVTSWGFEAFWPGENDGSGGRRVLVPSAVRISVNVSQAFTAQSLLLQVI